jgi:hypothetical protein
MILLIADLLISDLKKNFFIDETQQHLTHAIKFYDSKFVINSISQHKKE